MCMRAAVCTRDLARVCVCVHAVVFVDYSVSMCVAFVVVFARLFPERYSADENSSLGERWFSQLTVPIA